MSLAEKLAASREARLKAKAVKFKVEEWGEEVTLLPLLFKDVEEFTALAAKKGNNGAAVFMICKSIEGLSYPENAELISQEPISVITKLTEKINEISGLNKVEK